MNYLGFSDQEWEELDNAINELQNEFLSNPLNRARIEKNFEKAIEEKDIDGMYSYIKVQTSGPDHSAFMAKTKEYQAFDVVVTFDTECRYGGLGGFFWMCGKRYAVLVYDAFCVIGLPEIAALYRNFTEAIELDMDELDELSFRYESEKDKAYHERYSFKKFDEQYQKLRCETNLERIIASFAELYVLEKYDPASSSENGILDELDLLGKMEPVEPFEELCNYVLKESNGPTSQNFHELPEAIQTLDVILNFDMEVQNGGLLGFLENSGNAYARLVPDAFRKAELESFAILYEKFRQEMHMTEEWIAEFSAKYHSKSIETGEDAFDAFDDQYMELRDAEDLEEKLLRYAEDHCLQSQQ